MALSQVLTVLCSDRRRGHAGRLVSPHPSDPCGLELTAVHFEEAWCTRRIYDWRPVSLEIQPR